MWVWVEFAGDVGSLKCFFVLFDWVIVSVYLVCQIAPEFWRAGVVCTGKVVVGGGCCAAEEKRPAVLVGRIYTRRRGKDHG